MSVEAVKAAGGFTDEILVKNFVAISKEFVSSSNRIDQIENSVRHLGGHIGELFDITDQLRQVASKPKGVSVKYKVVIGVALGLYIGRKTMSNEFNKRLEQAKIEAKEQFENFVASQKQEKTTNGAASRDS